MALLTRQQARDNVCEARAYVRLLRDRLERERAHNERSTFATIADVLRYGVRLHGSGVNDGLSARESWCLSVGNAALAIGRAECLVLFMRLSSREKSAEAAWERIAGQLEAAGVTMTAEECRRQFPMMATLFLAELERRGIGRDLRREELAA
ncbi:MAG: hypothetical protein WA208_00790 [Thermoanaerobaculia bacterium]